MSPLEVRLLGGFEASIEGVLVTGFESRKARVLLAYLLLHAGQGDLSREQLATLFWPEADEDSGRKNLRQALYSVKTAIQAVGPETQAPLLMAGYHTVAVNPDRDVWLDVTEFQAAVSAGLLRGKVEEAAALADAVRLYRGDLLAGYLVDGSEELEQWLVTGQERLREQALEAVHALVEYHGERGEAPLAIGYARRHLDLDPLSEHAHRSLIRLYATSGRRSRALAQYESCVTMLRTEFGVPPLKETTSLYQAVLAEEVEALGLPGEPPPTCPTVPMVGRRTAYAALRESWERAQREGPRMALVSGEVGVGKTRLVKAFVHDACAHRPSRVLLARSHERLLPLPFEPWRDVALSAASADDAESLLHDLPDRVASALLDLAPAAEATIARQRRPGRAKEPPPAPFDEAISELLRASAHIPGEEPTSLILVFDDVHWADPDSLALLCRLFERGLPPATWIVATSRHESFFPQPLAPLVDGCSAAGTLDLVRVERLDDADVRQLALAITDDDEQALGLGDLLIARTQGLPLSVVEWVNLLCDEGLLEQRSDEKWHAPRALQSVEWAEAGPLTDLTQRRVARLPESSRRLLTLASLIGSTFEAGVLASAAQEQAAVVELAIEVLLQRWMVRHYPLRWFASRRERDVVLWAEGARRGVFEFAHKGIRRILSESVSPRRRQTLHRKIAEAMTSRLQPGAAAHAELACQYLAAEAWRDALDHLEKAVAGARDLAATGAAGLYLAAAVRTCNALEAEAGEATEKAHWQRERGRLAQQLAAIRATPEGSSTG